MNIGHFELLARDNLRRLVLIFVVFAAVTMLCIAVADWANTAGGWQADFVHYLFYGVAAISGLMALIFSISIYAWFAEYKVAKSDAAHFELEELRKLRRGVIGTIQWR